MPLVSTKKKPPGLGSLKSGVYFACRAGTVYWILSVSYDSLIPASMIWSLTFFSSPDLKPSRKAALKVLKLVV